MCYHSGPEWTKKQWQWRGASYSPRPEHYWDFTIRLFSVISRTLIGGGSCIGAVIVFYSPSRLGNRVNTCHLLFMREIFLNGPQKIYWFLSGKDKTILIMNVAFYLDQKEIKTLFSINSIFFMNCYCVPYRWTRPVGVAVSDAVSVAVWNSVSTRRYQER